MWVSEWSEAQALLASIVRSSHDAIWSMTLDGVITSWNPSAEDLFGYRADEIVGRHVSAMWPPGRKAAEEQLIEQVARGERTERCRTDRLHRDGRTVPVSLSLSPIFDGYGRIAGISSVCRDLGDRERAEARFVALLDAAPDAMVVVDRNGTIMLVNAQTEHMFGYAREELLGRCVDVLVPETGRERHAAYRGAYFADPRPRPMGAGRQLSALRRDGSVFPADISLASVDTDDGPLVVAAVRDVTERLAAEADRERLEALAVQERVDARLQQAQRLESLGQLAGGVAHDFNNLLAVIVNYAAFVGEEIETAAVGDPDRWHAVARDVQQVQRAADRGIALTHQLLAFGRREVVRPRVLSLNAVVREVQQLLRRSIGEHVQLVTSLTPGLWPVRADPGQLEQVLVNLAVNARDAMPGGGTLTIDTTNMPIDGQLVGARTAPPPGRYARVRVQDTGVGMAPDVVERAFEPFFTTKPKGEGTGLGLATVYGIVKQAGGDVHIYSEPGIGTTFHVLLPASDEDLEEAEEPAAATHTAGNGEMILVVEDEPAIREVSKRILERNGYHVMVADSGAEALRLVDGYSGAIDLLMTDVVMPRMLGKEVAERLRAVRSDTRVLYMSGYARPVLANTGTLDPGVTLLEKPFSEGALLAAVRQVLDA